MDKKSTYITVPMAEAPQSSNKSIVIGPTSLAELIVERDCTGFKDVMDKLVKSGNTLCILEKDYEILDNQTLLEYACQNGLADFVMILLKNNAELCRKSHSSTSPLHLAVQYNHPVVVQMLVSHGAVVNEGDSMWRTPLHIAAAGPKDVNNEEIPDSYLQVLRVLLSHPNIQLNMKDWDGATPLRLAADRKWEQAVRLLLKYGADPICGKVDGLTTLQVLEETMPAVLEVCEKDEEDDVFVDSTTNSGSHSWHFSTGPIDSRDYKRALSDDILKSAELLVSIPTPEFYRSVSCSGRKSKLSQNQIKLFKLLCRGKPTQVKELLQKCVDNNEDLNCTFGKHTFLQYAASLGYACATHSLLKFGADPNATSLDCDETPLLVAAKGGFYKAVRELWNNPKTDLKATNSEGQTILHILPMMEKLMRFNPSKFENESGNKNYETCLLELLQGLQQDFYQRIDINARDNMGNTPLHYAANSGSAVMIHSLLERGANLCIKNKRHEPALSHIPSAVLEEWLNTCVSAAGQVDSEKYKITFKYQFLTPSPICDDGNAVFVGQEQNEKSESVIHYLPETEVLWNIARCERLRHLLKHPVLSSFLYLKWQCIRGFYYMNLISYMVYVLLLTYFLLATYGNTDTREQTFQEQVDNSTNATTIQPTFFQVANRLFVFYLWYFVVIFNTWLFSREFFQLLTSFWRYFRSFENIMELTMIILTFLIIFSDFNLTTKRHMAPFVIILTWTELVMLVGRHPILTTYVQMFLRVTNNYLIFLISFSLFIIAFALSFYLLFNTCSASENNDECDSDFENPFLSLLQTILMMIGGFEFMTLPLHTLQGTSHIIFLLFLFLIVIVLVNLLNGLAVSDTQAIRDQAELYSLSSRVEMIFYVETLILGQPFQCQCVEGFRKVKRKLGLGQFCNCTPRLQQTLLQLSLIRRTLLFPSLKNCELVVYTSALTSDIIVKPEQFTICRDIVLQAQKNMESRKMQSERQVICDSMKNLGTNMESNLELLNAGMAEVRKFYDERKKDVEPLHKLLENVLKNQEKIENVFNDHVKSLKSEVELVDKVDDVRCKIDRLLEQQTLCKIELSRKVDNVSRQVNKLEEKLDSKLENIERMMSTLIMQVSKDK